MKKTGLYFGSFNPIHMGHLMIAEYLLEHSDLDDLWFVISPSNPLKKKEHLLDERQRYYMVNIAIEDDARFKACDIEFKLPYPSYTCVTLAKLTETYPDRAFVVIMGEDNIENIERWRNYEYILENFQIYVYPRPGHGGSKYLSHPHVTKVEAPLIEVSSTMIRDSIKNKKRVSYFLPSKVEQYIQDMGVYNFLKK